MKNYIWKSDLSQVIIDYIQIKKETGLKFAYPERCLQHFDHFHYYHGYEGMILTKELIEEFIYIKEETVATHYSKEVVMNHFTTYLNLLGITVYVPTIKTKTPKCTYIPYIFTKEELCRLFEAIDKYPIIPNSSRNTVDPILFRFLYSTGVRISEALNLRIEDVNLEDSFIVIKGAKNNKDRIVPMALSMTKRLSDYISSYHKYSELKTNVFPGFKDRKMDKSTAYNHFRDYLVMANIAHTKQGPRIHSFRHGLAVECLRRWSLAGEDLFNVLPYLSAYMGHTDFRATQYYLRLTAEIYPDIVKLIEENYGYVIPEEDFYYEES